VTPSPSDACSCAHSRLEISPSPHVAAPLNVQVRVAWSSGDADVNETTLALVAKSGGAVAIDRKARTAGAVRTVLLTPKKPLAANTTYQIKASSKSGSPQVLGEITTGTATDDVPPTWKGIGKTVFNHQPAVCCNCSTGDPWVSLELAEPVQDDQTASDAIAFGIWPADGKLDATALLAIVPAWGNAITLGHRNMCSPNNFSLPTRGKPLRVRVAPIDFAGNAGMPFEVKIELSNHP
jgi:hypothetical protein